MSGQLRLSRLLRLPVAGLAVAVALLGALSWLGNLHWSLELLSHFRLYYFLLGFATALAALALRLRGLAAVAALIASVNGAAAWPHVSLPATLLHSVPTPTVRILWVNLNNWATDLAALRHLIERENPDLAIVTELAQTQDATLREARALLPFFTPVPDGNALEVMLLSKRTPETVQFDRAMGERAPLLVARLCPAEASCLTLIALHASRPFPHADGARDRQLDHAAAVARRHIESGERVVLVGDLNVTPFSPVYERLLSRSGLFDTASMPAVHARAPNATWWPFGIGIGLAIDHVLVGPGVTLVERRLGMPIRSEHLPLTVDVRIAP